MLPMRSSAVPINPGHLALISGAKPNRQVIYSGMRGMASCGCSPVSGCGCGMNGMAGLGQSASLDQIISNAFSWLSGTVQTAAGPSAAVPSGVSSLGTAFTTLTGYLPYIIIGYLAYKAIK